MYPLEIIYIKCQWAGLHDLLILTTCKISVFLCCRYHNTERWQSDKLPPLWSLLLPTA